MKAFKTIVCIILATCTFLLTGCNNWLDDADRFSNSCKQLCETPGVYVIYEVYRGNTFEDLTQARKYTQWESGENFYRTDGEGKHTLGYDGSYWTGENGVNALDSTTIQWKQEKQRLYPYGPWRYDPKNYLTDNAVFDRKDGYIILEHKKDVGTTCTLDRQVHTDTFFMDEDWGLVKIIRTTITYDGREIDANKISGVMQGIYYITPIDAEEAEKIVHTHYLDAVQ